MTDFTSEITDISGLAYKRLPADGEWIDIEAWSDKGGMVACYVYACTGTAPNYTAREIIAWDQGEIPRKADAHKNAYRRRVGLAARARDHWMSMGRVVRYYASDDV